MVEVVYAKKPNDKVKLGIERRRREVGRDYHPGSRPVRRRQAVGAGRAAAGNSSRPASSAEDVEGGGVEVTRFIGENATQGGTQGRRHCDQGRWQAGRRVSARRSAPMTEKKAGDKIKLARRARQERKEKLDVTVTLAEGRGGGGGGGGPSTGGPTADKPYATTLGGQRENVQDQQGPDGFQTGGVYKSTDGWRHLDARQQPQPAADVLQPDPRRSDQRQAPSTSAA